MGAITSTLKIIIKKKVKGKFNRHEPYSLLGKKSNEQIFRRRTLKNKNTISLVFPHNKILKGEKKKRKKKEKRKGMIQGNRF